MVSKLIGIGLVGLTQYAIWGVCGLLITSGSKALLGRAAFALPHIGMSLWAYCVCFFLLGYFLIGTLHLIAGSITARAEDGSQLASIITVVNLLPLFIVWIVMKDPNSTTSIVLSFIPFFTPSIMMVRIAVGSTPVWQTLAAACLMLASIAGALWTASKVYRAKILIYGKRLTMAEMGRWLRYS